MCSLPIDFLLAVVYNENSARCVRQRAVEEGIVHFDEKRGATPLLGPAHIQKFKQIFVLVWEYKTAVRKAKREWLEKYNFPADKCHFITYGRTKADCIRRVADAPAVLIDDNKKVRDGWHLGESIDPTKVNLLEVLSALD